MEWGICTTAKAPLQEILAFIAWHKHLGASHIWVHLDDADLAKGEILNGIDGVTAVLCDADYWARNKKGRPDAHQARQSYNMRQVYKLNALPCIAHIDVDEYLYPHRDLDEILAGWDSGPLLRAAPAEALHDPSLPDDIFTARQFRRPFPKDLPAQARQEVLGEYEGIIPKNILSHSVGKAFFRTGIPRLRPRIHGAFGGSKAPQGAVSSGPDCVAFPRTKQRGMGCELAPPCHPRGVSVERGVGGLRRARDA